MGESGKDWLTGVGVTVPVTGGGGGGGELPSFAVTLATFIPSISFTRAQGIR
jgi:hypothetical protein